MTDDSVAMGDFANLKLFAGSSHPELAAEIAAYLNTRVCAIHTERFSNDNLMVQLGESVRGKDVVIIQSFTPNVSEHLLEMLMMIDAARSASAKTIHAVIPYYSYARSDKKDAPRISIAGRLIADLMMQAGVDHVMTMTLHSSQVHGFFSVPADHLTADEVFVDYFRTYDLSNSVVVSPDIGHAKRASRLARSLGIGVAAGDKERQTDESVSISTIIGDVDGKDVIVFDDEIATAGSVVELVAILKTRNVGRVTLACTHGVLSGPAIERLSAMDNLYEIVTTNTVPIPPHKRLPNLRVLSVGHIFGRAIGCNFMGQSISSLFAFWSDKWIGH